MPVAREPSAVTALAEGSGHVAAPPLLQRRTGRTLWAAAVLGLGVLAAGAGWWRAPELPEHHPVTRFQFQLPEGQAFSRVGRHVVALSPDGTKLAYVANGQLYLRRMDQLDPQPIRGTGEDPMQPVFSPDGEWLAYFAPNQATGEWFLRKVPLAGGAPVTLASVPVPPYGASWRHGTIAFAMNFEAVYGIQAVPDSGGSPRTLVSVDPATARAAHPFLLDDGRHVLFVVMPIGAARGDEGQIVVQAFDGSERRVVVSGGTNPILLPPGGLVYRHAGALFAVPFDAKRLAVTGGAVPVVEGVVDTRATWAGHFAIAANGTLAFWAPWGCV